MRPEIDSGQLTGLIAEKLAHNAANEKTVATDKELRIDTYRRYTRIFLCRARLGASAGGMALPPEA